MSAVPYGRTLSLWKGDKFVQPTITPFDEPGAPTKKVIGFPTGSTRKQATYTGNYDEAGRTGEGSMWLPPYEAPTVVTGVYEADALVGDANVAYPKERAIDATFDKENGTTASVLTIPIPKAPDAAEEDPAPKPVKYDRINKVFFQDPDPVEEEAA
ncbi:hypothetical protein PPROV_000475700 [Pycnococcus provasolii]|uniref:Uncharacterized protein n=1 Tax=Pycnococcus provasolii TaxID=41880 RepID=A0A830HJM7_9CHLO|nr:hypothetical protein PPROV_000475700 [Pycnococcus provasolii]